MSGRKRVRLFFRKMAEDSETIKCNLNEKIPINTFSKTIKLDNLFIKLET